MNNKRKPINKSNGKLCPLNMQLGKWEYTGAIMAYTFWCPGTTLISNYI